LGATGEDLVGAVDPQHLDQAPVWKLTWAAGQLLDAIVIANREGTIEFTNRAFEALPGFAGIRAVGCTLAILSGAEPTDFPQRLRSALVGGKAFRDVVVNRTGSGELFHTEWVISPLSAGTGVITHFVASGRDVTDRVRAEERLKRAAEHDGLTGLPNRNVFRDRLAQLVKHSARRNLGFALAIIDVDQFKAINDRVGHIAGDALLQAVALRIQSCIRSVDTLARLGGDEFGLILVDATDTDAASRVAAKIVASLRTPIRPERQRAIRTSISLGACLYPEHGADDCELLKRADAAMYAAKKAGGNRYRFERPNAVRGGAPAHGLPAALLRAPVHIEE
jgi:diguanylate cyclase (GGDEF)-like protein/PAS domain S-box-containing protein